MVVHWDLEEGIGKSPLLRCSHYYCGQGWFEGQPEGVI